MIRVRRRNGRIEVPALRPAQRDRMLQLAEQYVSLAQEHEGKTRGELNTACEQVPYHETDYKLVKGLRKLVFDRCDFEVRDDVDPRVLRRDLFRRAAAVRQAMADGDSFDRQGVLDETGRESKLTSDEVVDALYADLKENHRLASFKRISPPSLVDGYEMAQKQAVLLRATKVVVQLH